MVDDAWVQAATPAELEGLAACLLNGSLGLGPAYTGIGAERAGYAPATAFLRSMRGIDPKVVAWALRSIARERRKAEETRS